MNDLGHYEFGLGHKPLKFPDQTEQTSQLVADTQTYCDLNDPNYWLDRWCDAYQYLLQQLNTTDDQFVILDFNRLASDHDPNLDMIFEILNIPNQTREPIDFNVDEDNVNKEMFCEQLLARAEQIKLDLLAIQQKR